MGGDKNGSLLARLRIALPGLLLLKPFINRFARTTQVVSDVLGTHKNQGLSQAIYEHCLRLSETLSKNAKVKQRLQQWLHRHIAIQQAITDLLYQRI